MLLKWKRVVLKRLDVSKKFFSMRVMKHWKRLPRELADCPSLETLKVMLDGGLWAIWSIWKCPCSRGWTRLHLKDPSSPDFYDSVKAEHDSTDSTKLYTDLIYSRIYLAFNGIQVVSLVLKKIEASSITSGSCLRMSSHSCVRTKFPVYVETGISGMVAPWSTLVSSRHKVSHA